MNGRIAVPSDRKAVYVVRMRDFILQEIRRLASANGGQAPGQKLFGRETGIGERQWRGLYWSRWSDVLRDAGFEPNKLNERVEADELISGVIAALRHFGRLPTEADMQVLRRTNPEIPHPNVLKSHFGKKADLIAALAKHVVNNPVYADVAAMLPEQSDDVLERQPSSKPVKGFVYLIKSGDFYKIGRSDDAERRFKQISIALPDKAELFHTIRTDDPPGIEAYWHRRFDDRRANGEWFRLTPQDVAAFKKRKFQ
ncbi:GIY-YIG nuclease family protein [Methylovirgula sp. 4M-Z18]|nr:GIY-YIG nuclease family protein [Methylovirgula sp. 4M-Z18]